jgi:hypothetical protein
MSKLYQDKPKFNAIKNQLLKAALTIEVFTFFIGAVRDIIIIKDLSKQISSSILDTEYT